MNKIILIGGGGHCKSCIDVIESTGEYTIEGILDPSVVKGQTLYGYPYIGDDGIIPELIKKKYQFFITVGQIYSSDIREKCFSRVKSLGGQLVTVVSPRAWLSKGVEVGEGTIIMHDALINADAKIGNNCIINSKSLIEHDVSISDNCHISTGAIVNGGAFIGSSSFVGSGSVVIQSVIAPNSSFIKANSIFVGKRES
jgi:sugar O-acyltransferase (sialic acid O-acetyltransferase NeuD family)